MADTVKLRSGLEMPTPGYGTWRLGEELSQEAEELSALARAMELGFTHFDTAEMYGEGATESLLGRAIAGRREGLFLTSKVYPWNASQEGIVRACEGSLKRLGTDVIDVYLLHWPGSAPFEETLEGALRLRAAGKIRAFGVSNFDASEMESLIATGLAEEIEVNQVMYNPSRRGIEFDLLPLLETHGIACMAYTPIEPQRLARIPRFVALAEAAGLSVAGLALAWQRTRARTVPIPKAGTPAHAEDLWHAGTVRLDAETLAAIERVCPPPAGPRPLDIL